MEIRWVFCVDGHENDDVGTLFESTWCTKRTIKENAGPTRAGVATERSVA